VVQVADVKLIDELALPGSQASTAEATLRQVGGSLSAYWV